MSGTRTMMHSTLPSRATLRHGSAPNVSSFWHDASCLCYTLQELEPINVILYAIANRFIPPAGMPAPWVLSHAAPALP